MACHKYNSTTHCRIHESGGRSISVYLVSVALLFSFSAANSQPLITGINTEAFVDALGLEDFRATNVSGWGVTYEVTSGDEALRSLRIGVHSSVAGAETVFNDAEKERSGTLVSQDFTPPIGDQCRISRLEDFPGTLRLRRDNALVEGHWRGDRSAAIQFARAVDNLLIQDRSSCPRDDAVSPPDVTFVVPERVAANGRVKISYCSSGMNLLRSDGHVPLHSEGSRVVRAGDPGRQEHTFIFATSRNVIFAESCSFRVLSEKQLLREGIPVPWDIQGTLLYFLKQSDQKWGSIPATEREWLRVEHSTHRRLTAPVVSQQLAINDLACAFKFLWLPRRDMVEVAEDASSQINQKVYHSEICMHDCHLIFMGVIGRQVLLYLEQPADAVDRIQLQDILKPDWMQPVTVEGQTIEPQLQVMSRSMERYRAFRPEGPYDHVHILLVDVRFPVLTDLKYPGYH